MSYDFKIVSNLNEIGDWIMAHEKMAAQSAKKAINRTLTKARVISIKRMKKTYKIKRGGLSASDLKNMMIIKKARGGLIETVEGSIIYKGSPISMLNFVSGKKDIIKQKGVKVSKRRKLKVEITPGKKLKLRKGFIAKKHTKQVFKAPSDGFKKQAVPSIAWAMDKRGNLDQVQRLALRFFDREFQKDLQARVQRNNLRLSRSPLKKVRY